MLNTIELYPWEKICQLWCNHCIRKSDWNTNIKITNEQSEVFLKTQEILSKNTNFQQLLRLNAPINLINNDIPISKKYKINALTISINEEAIYKWKDSVNKTILDSLTNINKILSNMNNIPRLDLWIPLKENIFDINIWEKKKLSLLYKYIYQFYWSLIEEDKIKKYNLIFWTNDINNTYYKNFKKENLYMFFNLFKIILKEEIFKKKDYKLYKNNLEINNEYILSESTYIGDNSYIQLFYRIISTIFHEKYYNLYQTNNDTWTIISIHPDKIQIWHTTHNINNENFWFSYEEYYKILNNKSVTDYTSFKKQYLKILENRWVDIVII